MALLRQRTYGTVVGLSLWMLAPFVGAAPDTTMTIAPSATSGTTILSADENDRSADVSTAYNVHSHTDITQVGTPLNIGASSGRSSIGDASIVLEGSTNNDSETTLSVTDPTVDRTITIPNETGNLITFSNANTQDVNLIFEGATANDFETTLTITDPTTPDKTITFADLTGTVGLINAVQTVSAAWTFSTAPSIANPTITGAAPSVPIANVLYADSLIKGWIKFDGAATPATITSDFNVVSLTDTGTGDYTIVWETDFSSANYSVVCTNTGDGATGITSMAVGNTAIRTFDSNGALIDRLINNCIAVGAQ